MKHIIYKTTNNVNNKIYIGKHSTFDIHDEYLGSGKLLTKAIKKYGINNFSKEILHICASADEAFILEAQIVNEEFVARTDTYNIKVGGFGGWDHVNSKVQVKFKEITCKTCKNIFVRNNRSKQVYCSNSCKTKDQCMDHLKSNKIIKVKRISDNMIVECSMYEFSKKFNFERRHISTLKTVRHLHGWTIFDENINDFRQSIILPKAKIASNKIKCNFCDKISTMANITRWHNDNCKLKLQSTS